MIARILSSTLKKSASKFPVVTITGPRQSGKTTLVRSVFKDHDYVSLELPDERAYATEDPRGFLARFKNPVIFDEVQRTPELFSYIQAAVDEPGGKTGRFILTGSQNFLLMEKISQTLAGRCAVLHLLPLSLAEIMNREPLSLERIGKIAPKTEAPYKSGLNHALFTGSYPRIHDKRIDPREWLSSYYETYVERDVRNILNVGDIETFGRFVRLCAGRSGRILNLSELASDAGITHTTARRWISVLETSFIITLLRPYYRNFGKRLIKSPKLYFLDTGLLCFLLQINSADDLNHRAERGAVFETFVVSELYKNFSHRAARPSIYYWRDSAGHEIDVLIEVGGKLVPVEAKSAATVASDFFNVFSYFGEISKNAVDRFAIIYGGDIQHLRNGVYMYPWYII